MVHREPTDQLDPPTAPALPSDDRGSDQRADRDAPADPGGFESACPVCGRRLGGFASYCPHCHAHLPFGGTFSPGKTAVAKALSWILLVVFLGSMAILFGLIVRQMI